MSLDYLCRWHPVFNPVAPYRDLLPNVYLFMADITNPDLFVCVSDLDLSGFVSAPAIQRVRMAGLP